MQMWLWKMSYHYSFVSKAVGLFIFLFGLAAHSVLPLFWLWGLLSYWVESSQCQFQSQCQMFVELLVAMWRCRQSVWNYDMFYALSVMSVPDSLHPVVNSKLRAVSRLCLIFLSCLSMPVFGQLCYSLRCNAPNSHFLRSECFEKLSWC